MQTLFCTCYLFYIFILLMPSISLPQKKMSLFMYGRLYDFSLEVSKGWEPRICELTVESGFLLLLFMLRPA
uniref:Putative ovule protein n=1 Tax=Solanum chacoense TaxID=4108 RepID=A0A0V0HK85_SOLCH